jgi:hypothetical protein
MRNNLNLKSILLAGMLLLSFGIGRAQSDRAFYRDYEGMVTAMTGKVRQYMAAHPEVRIDSIRKHVYQVKLEGTITHAEPLQKERTKHLSADKIYELGCKSSLIFGKMEHMDAIGKDTAYITASAVALTKEGICATNYHVVADVVLSGALDYAPKGDEMRFVMDHDGRVYPMTVCRRLQRSSRSLTATTTSRPPVYWRNRSPVTRKSIVHQPELMPGKWIIR